MLSLNGKDFLILSQEPKTGNLLTVWVDGDEVYSYLYIDDDIHSCKIEVFTDMFDFIDNIKWQPWMYSGIRDSRLKIILKEKII